MTGCMMGIAAPRYEIMLRQCYPVQETYGDDAQMWWVRWRLFYISCSEFFGARNGAASGVGHYVFRKK